MSWHSNVLLFAMPFVAMILKLLLRLKVFIIW